MYSEDIDKVCRLCVFSRSVDGIKTHIMCTKDNAYYQNNNEACLNFKYDIFKKNIKRRKKYNFNNFSDEDFKL